MATKRVFSKDITDSDKFLDMPLSTQALYFHLALHGDIKGFVHPRVVMRICGAKEDDLKILISKNFVIPFKSGVVVITHWNVHNSLRESHEAKSRYEEEAQSLTLENGVYKGTTGELQENYSSTTVELPHKLREVKLREDNIYITSSSEESFEIFVGKFNEVARKKFTTKNKKAKKQYSDRLKDGYKLEEIIQALKNALEDDFHRQSNYKYITPEFITRPDKLERFINFQPSSIGNSNNPMAVKGESGKYDNLVTTKINNDE